VTSVVFAPTIAAAKRAGRGRGGFLFASPRSDEALDRALADGLPVRFFAPKAAADFWALVRRRYRLPAAPGLLRDAIGGIARHHAADVQSGKPRGGPSRGRLEALWIEGVLSDSRARSILRESKGTRLWVIEDFRKLRVSESLFPRLERAGIRIAALRPLRASVLRFRS
jgi:hypothetical protein